MTDVGTSEEQERRRQIDRSLDGAVARAERELGSHAPAVRDTLGELRTRLQRVHARPHEIDDQRWAGYVTDLDRGLAELTVEVARIAEHPADGLSVDDVLYVHRTRFEVDGWALRLAAIEDVPATPTTDPVPACEVELARFRAAATSGRSPDRGGVDKALHHLRSTVENVDSLGRAGQE